MRRRSATRARGGPAVAVAACLLPLAGVACQPDTPARLRAQGEGAGAPTGAGAAGAPGAATAHEPGAPPGVSWGEAPAAEPVPYLVFEEEADPEGRPRATLHLLIQARAGRDELRRTLVDVLEERAAADTSLVALRAVAYVARSTGGAGEEADLVPRVWAEWVPPEGWDRAARRDRRRPHRVYVYHDHEAVQEW